MRALAGILAALVLLGAAAAPQGELDEAALRARIAALGQGTPEAEFAALVQAGEGAAHLALEGFALADAEGQRARARLRAAAGGPASVAGVLALLEGPESPHPAVRLALVRFLGRAALGDEDLERRLELLARSAAEDPVFPVRATAIAALGECGSPHAVGHLDQLLERLPAGEAPEAARVLAGLSYGRARVVARVQGAFTAPPGRPRLGAATLAVLLGADGEALASLPTGGETEAERVPLVLGRVHPARRVRAAALKALGDIQTRLVEFQEFARADRLLAALAADGVSPRDLLYRRCHLALADTGDAAAALRHAEALLADTRGAETADERTWRTYALHFRAAARLALGDGAAAREDFEAERDVLRGLLAEREDLRPSLHRRPDWPISPVGGSVLVDRLLNLGLVELWLATCLLTEGTDPADPVLLGHLRSAHEARLRAQLVGLSTDAAFNANSFDDFLDRELGPRRLLLTNPRLAGWGGGRGIDVELLLGRALATVCPREVPGFAPAEVTDAALGDPYLDDVRFSLMAAIQDAEFDGAWRAWWAEQREMERRATRADDPTLSDPDARRNSPAFWRVGAVTEARQQQDERARRLDPDVRREPARRRELFPEFARFQMPSTFALTLSGELRAEGRAAEARELSERMLEDLRALGGVNPVWVEWVSARLESSIGASYMDEDRPAEAERVYGQAEERLAALENTLRNIVAEAEAGDDGGRAAGAKAQLDRTRSLRGDVLLSLAVNANVRHHDPEKALAYFEKAYELDRRDFMRGLRACYRARSGRVVEARAVLQGLQPAPALYYNLACTHALLGDVDQALDYLQREFEENHPTEGSLRRQKEWARSDPDLANLRAHPRFERLVGE